MKKLIDGLYEEYRLIQNKIDRIASFAFRVKGWCITLQTAIIIGIVSGKINTEHIYIIILLMLFLVFIFHFLEQEQIEIKIILARRAVLVEQALDRLVVDRNETEIKKESKNKIIFENLKGSPRTAIFLQNESPNRAKQVFKNMRNCRTNIFYYLLYAVLLLSLIISLVFGSKNNDMKVPITISIEIPCESNPR